MRSLPLVFLALLASLSISRAINPDVPTLSAPADLVAALYRQHDAKSPFFQTDGRARLEKYFAEPLAALLWKDAVDSKGEVGALDFDPLYDSQDPAPKNLVVQPAKIRKEKATVVVTFENLGENHRIVFTLVPVADGWKISDIRWAKDRTLLSLLKPAGG